MNRLHSFPVTGVLLFRRLAEQNLQRVFIGRFLFRRGDQQFNYPFFRRRFGFASDLFHHPVFYHPYGGFHQVPYHGIHIPANVTDLCKLGGFHLDEGCIDKLCKPSGNLGFAYTGRAYH